MAHEPVNPSYYARKKSEQSNPQSRLAGLTGEELSEWQQMIEHRTTMFIYMKRLRNRLALTRASDARKWELLKKHEWVRHDDEDSEYGEIWVCPDCCEVKRDGHAPDCALDAELKGGG